MPQQLIKVDYTKDQPTVSARELHKGLEIGTRFNDWFSRMCEYGFSSDLDFYSKMSKTSEQGGRPSTDYEISIDMAKQICMIQRTDKGKEYRQYFIDLEKAWNTPEQVMARALRIANGEIEKLKADNQVLIADTERMKPKEIFADAVSASKTSILVGNLAKLLKQNGYETGQKRLFEQLRQEGYLIKSGSSRNMPTQRAIQMQLFEVKETSITNPDGSIRITKTTKVTGKGQQYFINKYLVPAS